VYVSLFVVHRWCSLLAFAVVLHRICLWLAVVDLAIVLGCGRLVVLGLLILAQWHLLFGLHLLPHVVFVALLVDLLHVVPRCQHLMLGHRVASVAACPLLALSFAFFGSTFVEGRVQLL
jgi:hypothetical protein